MTAGLETFAKVRALHDRTDRWTSPGTQAPDRGTVPVRSGQTEGATMTVLPSHRTTADRCREVLVLLDVEGIGGAPLTDREIARRVGVSPTTVGTIRRAAGGAAG